MPGPFTSSSPLGLGVGLGDSWPCSSCKAFLTSSPVSSSNGEPPLFSFLSPLPLTPFFSMQTHKQRCQGRRSLKEKVNNWGTCYIKIIVLKRVWQTRGKTKKWNFLLGLKLKQDQLRSGFFKRPRPLGYTISEKKFEGHELNKHDKSNTENTLDTNITFLNRPWTNGGIVYSLKIQWHCVIEDPTCSFNFKSVTVTSKFAGFFNISPLSRTTQTKW